MTIKVFVAGATGKQGGATARALLAAGHEVHAYVRNTSSPAAQALEGHGATLLAGDWDDLSALQGAVAGCTAAFFPSMPSFTDLEAEERWAANILNAATESGTVRHVVYSTVGIMAYADKIKEIPGWDDNTFIAQYLRAKASGEEAVRQWAARGPDGQRKYTNLRPGGFSKHISETSLVPFLAYLTDIPVDLSLAFTSLGTGVPELFKCSTKHL